ncbi:MAG: ComEC/Rec2 family competence protein [Planctomycetota bacterium]|jgi:ComEC/Rec2-related protein|nr:ComEC/Rec2 family competence protein [Planctomycetota bacterium]
MPDVDLGSVQVPPARPWLPWLATGLVVGALGWPLAAEWRWWAVVLGVALAALALLWPGVRWPVLRRLGIACAAAACGLVVAPPPLDVDTPERLVAVTGTVHRAWPGRYDQRFVLSQVQVQQGALPPAPDRVFCRKAPLLPAVLPGDAVQVAGRWTVGERGPELLVTTLTVRIAREQRAQGRAWRSIDRLGAHRQLAGALILGRGAPPERDSFHKAGLLHMLAVSGLHLGLALGGIYVLASWAGVPWLARQWLTIAAAMAYLWFTGGSLPTQRAAVMAVAIIAHRLLGRRAHRLTGISLAVIALVLWAPAEVATASFQLTVVAVAGIATLGLDLMALRRRYLPLRPWPLDRVAWRGLLALTRGACDGLAVGVAASLAVLPVIALHFHEIQIYGALVSVVASPALTLALVAGLAYVLCSTLWLDGPWEGLAALTSLGLGSLVWVADRAAGLPASLWADIAPPPVWLWFAWPCLFIPLRDRVDLLLRGAAVAAMALGWWLSG